MTLGFYVGWAWCCYYLLCLYHFAVRHYCCHYLTRETWVTG